MPRPAISLRERFEEDPARGFGSPAAFVTAVIDNADARDRDDVADMRLRALCVRDDDDRRSPGELAFMLPMAFAPRSLMAAAGSDEAGEYSDTYGGSAMPAPAVFPGQLSAVELDPTSSRTRAFPMAVPQLDIPCRVDKDHSTSLSGGFTASRQPETIAFPASRGGLELVSLKAAALVGLDYATNELLIDSAGSFAALIDAGFRDEMGAVLLNEKIRGLGGNQYTGVLNAACKIAVDKEAGQSAETIVADNVFNMSERCWRYEQGIWLANHDTRREIYGLSLAIGTGGVAVFQPAQTEGAPDMLCGRPLFWTEHCSTLGDEGDLVLVNWSQYLEGTYQPFTAASSIHARFENHESVFKFWVRNAGACWWRSELTPRNSTTTLSPIVTLAERA